MTISTFAPLQQFKPEQPQLAHQTPYPNFVMAGMHTRNDNQCANVMLFGVRFYQFMFSHFMLSVYTNVMLFGVRFYQFMFQS